MLKKLRIKDFTLIDQLEIDFQQGFQVLTGETGAGKSIIVGAVGLLCGQRGQAEVVRTGQNKAILEAEYELNQNEAIKSLLEMNDIEFTENSLTIRREISNKGVSRAFVNDSLVTISTLSNLASLILDLHGQHQHQKLLYVENHVSYLDAFASIEDNLVEFKNIYKIHLKLYDELKQIEEQRQKSTDLKDLYSFQAAELEKANLDIKEAEELKNEKLKLENSEQLFSAADFVSNILYSSDDSILLTVSKALNKLKEVQQFDKEFQDLATNLSSAQVLIEEVGRSAEFLKDRIEFNPERLEEIRAREAEIDWLLKKYRVNEVKDLIQYREKIQSELNRIENYDADVNRIQGEIDQVKLELSKSAIRISKLRKESARNLEEKMKQALFSLGMNNVQFKVNFSVVEDPNGIIDYETKHYKCFDDGMDQVEFLISLNKGEPLKPLQKIASGGEISRIMLAIKSILNESDNTNTLIFDEIDSGISGKIAQIVGNRLKEIGLKKQLIVITHLAQIAAQAEAQYAVEKYEKNGNTNIRIKQLDKDERILEIAKLLGGEKISEEAIANAKNLLNDSSN